MTKRISYSVTGKVQGVFFRQSTMEEARKLGITGFVLNDPSGHVAGEAQGDESKLKDFVSFLEQGPPSARVNQVDTSDISTKDGEKSFSIGHA